MRKILFFILILVLTVVLVACASISQSSTENDIYEQANALMENGKYEEALAMYQSIESYQKISAKIAEAEAYIAASTPSDLSNTFLYTEWIDLIFDKNHTGGRVQPRSLTFLEDGTVHDKQGYNDYAEIIYRYTWESGDITIITNNQSVALRLRVEEIDGVVHLRGSFAGDDFDFVAEHDYDILKQG